MWCKVYSLKMQPTCSSLFVFLLYIVAANLQYNMSHKHHLYLFGWLFTVGASLEKTNNKRLDERFNYVGWWSGTSMTSSCGRVKTSG
jgi:hypothetical protein